MDNNELRCKITFVINNAPQIIEEVESNATESTIMAAGINTKGKMNITELDFDANQSLI